MKNIVERAYERIHIDKDFDPAFVRELIAYLYMSTGEARHNARRWSAVWKRAAKRWRRIKFAEAQEKLVAELLKDGLYRISIDDVTEARQVARRLLRERDKANYENAALWRMYAEWGGKNAELQSQVNHLESDRDALARQVDELRKVLEQVEWVKNPFFDDEAEFCPWCEQHKPTFTGDPDWHTPDCARQRALGKA